MDGLVEKVAVPRKCGNCSHYTPRKCLRFPHGGYPLSDHVCDHHTLELARPVHHDGDNWDEAQRWLATLRKQALG